MLRAATASGGLAVTLMLVAANGCDDSNIDPGTADAAADSSGGGDAVTGSDVVVAPDAGLDAGGSGTPAVRFVGRFDRSDPAAPRFAWSGSGIIARFTGSSVGVRLGGGQQYTVVLDGAVLPGKLIPVAGAVSPISSGLAAGPHVVELYRRTEASQGESQFLGFDFGAGALLPPPAAPDRRLEFIGDSITCGFGVEGPDMNCHFTPDTENHYLTFAAIATRNLAAESVTVAWSGKGVLCNYGDDPASCTDPLPAVYDRTLPNRADSRWNFASWQPHAVVINLGTNDLSTAMDPTQAQFVAAYRAFLQSLRGKYPGALILCTVAPLLSGAELTAARAYINEAITATGDARIKSLEMAPTDPADGWGCDFHPSVKTHQKMAAVVTARLKAELGW